MKTLRSPWLLAAMSTAMVGLWEARTVLQAIPRLTTVDVCALLATGFLAGLFTGLHLNRGGREPSRARASR